jgi:hypothetical protein
MLVGPVLPLASPRSWLAEHEHEGHNEELIAPVVADMQNQSHANLRGCAHL